MVCWLPFREICACWYLDDFGGALDENTAATFSRLFFLRVNLLLLFGAAADLSW